MDAERTERLKVIAVEMDSIVRDIGPKWIRLAHLREEAQQIIAEAESKEAAGERR
jgi:hypothetical protein